MPFFQDPPRLGNQFTDDRVLRSYLARALPEEVRRAVEPSLATMGELAGGTLYELQLADRTNEPKLVHWDAWGRRVYAGRNRARSVSTRIWQYSRTVGAETAQSRAMFA